MPVAMWSHNDTTTAKNCQIDKFEISVGKRFGATVKLWFIRTYDTIDHRSYSHRASLRDLLFE